MNIPDRLTDLLRRERSFFIAIHIDPDGDALGSSLALSDALVSLGKEVTLYSRDPVPEIYRYLPGWERVTNSISNPGAQISNLILIDCNEPDRTGLEDVKFRHSAVIDHHETMRDFGDIKWIEPSAPATGLMVFYLIRALNAGITSGMATNLYSAIAVDTGTFRYSNTTSEVLRVSSELVASGANPAYISKSLYETWSDRRFSLLISVLDTLEMQGDIAVMHVTQDMFRATGTAPEDTENFSNFPRMIKTVKVSVFLRELDSSSYKISMRSKGDVNVAGVAEAFGGGGHMNAAGCKIKGNLGAVKEALLKAIKSKMPDA
ncbi:MAG: bifunctional oligoribonuclease/PAP phosphatase NrnA [Nitrospirota bacterium]